MLQAHLVATALLPTPRLGLSGASPPHAPPMVPTHLPPLPPTQIIPAPKLDGPVHHTVEDYSEVIHADLTSPTTQRGPRPGPHDLIFQLPNQGGREMQILAVVSPCNVFNTCLPDNDIATCCFHKETFRKYIQHRIRAVDAQEWSLLHTNGLDVPTLLLESLPGYTHGQMLDLLEKEDVFAPSWELCQREFLHGDAAYCIHWRPEAASVIVLELACVQRDLALVWAPCRVHHWIANPTPTRPIVAYSAGMSLHGRDALEDLQPEEVRKLSQRDSFRPGGCYHWILPCTGTPAPSSQYIRK